MTSILDALRAVVATSAAHAPEHGPLIDRVEAQLAAGRALADALERELTAEELGTLTRALVELHLDPLDNEESIEDLLARI